MRVMLCGPTVSGKTFIALRLQELGYDTVDVIP